LVDASDFAKAETRVGRTLDKSNQVKEVKQKDLIQRVKSEEGGQGEFLVLGFGTQLGSDEEDLPSKGGIQ
jgi:hypothetical protein